MMIMTQKIPKTILQGWDVLLVDDEPDSLEVAQRILKFYSANVLAAENGQEALAIAVKARPKFVLTDLSMPVLDGWGLLYEMRQDPRTLETPVFALTAHAMTGDRERALAAGFHNYLTKPLMPATFINDLLLLIEGVPELASQLRYN